MGLQIHKDDGEVIKKTKAAIASSYGSTPGVTQGGVTRIRNKTIPIINPMVKSSNWPQSNYKKGKFSKRNIFTYFPKHTTYCQNDMCLKVKCEGICGLWVLNLAIQQATPKRLPRCFFHIFSIIF